MTLFEPTQLLAKSARNPDIPCRRERFTSKLSYQGRPRPANRIFCRPKNRGLL